MFDELARHECADGSDVVVGRDRHGHILLFDGPDGRETEIRFTRVDVARQAIEFSIRTAECRTVKTGSIEGAPSAFGDVGAWLEDVAAGVEAGV